ncbi:MAG: ORC-CDC6 family AAA ATPase, partial [Bacteriovorax sp.]
HIGIYWRVDTQFCNSLNFRGLDEYEWISIFESYFALVIAIEIIRSLKVIADSSFKKFDCNSFDTSKLYSLPDFHPDYPDQLNQLEYFLETGRRKFSSWVSNVASSQKPFLPPGKTFLEEMIKDIRRIEGLENASFYIYIDEIENLVPYQRRVLNSFLKHSQKPLIVSFTSKELAKETATTGAESINATHDFNLFSLDEEFLDENERKLFFAEVFLANLDLAKNNRNSELLKVLRDLSLLEYRSEEFYKQKIFSEIKKRFPSKTFRELANYAISEPRTMNVLEERILKGISNHSTESSLEDFLCYKNIPDALLIVPALLNRPKQTPEKILLELSKYSDSKKSAFDNLISNNLVGALLELYRPYKGLCPIYSGFDTFCTMANNNLRHFLILSYKALEVADLSDENQYEIPVETQARAAYEAADRLIREIKTFAPLGERLRMFVLRLGSVFRTLQANPAMSEPEQNQFTINSGDRVLSDEETSFISEAIKHSIITEQLETKTKSMIGRDMVDYQLNPIYSPYFQISYRRKRKIEISVEDFQILAFGTENDYTELSKKLVKNTKLTRNENFQEDIFLQ